MSRSSWSTSTTATPRTPRATSRWWGMWTRRTRPRTSSMTSVVTTSLVTRCSPSCQWEPSQLQQTTKWSSARTFTTANPTSHSTLSSDTTSQVRLRVLGLINILIQLHAFALNKQQSDMQTVQSHGSYICTDQLEFFPTILERITRLGGKMFQMNSVWISKLWRLSGNIYK